MSTRENIRLIARAPFRGTFANSVGHQFHLFFSVKLKTVFWKLISVHFYLQLISMSIGLAHEWVQITMKLFLHCRSFEFPSDILFQH